jgi:hypothetical protein
VHTDCLVGRIRKRKTAKDIVVCFKRLRACYPMQLRIYVVMDNLSANIRAAEDFFPGRNMEAVYLPTEASWLNAIESEFTALHDDTIESSPVAGLYPANYCRCPMGFRFSLIHHHG